MDQGLCQDMDGYGMVSDMETVWRGRGREQIYVAHFNGIFN